jgi:hypothetical protein
VTEAERLQRWTERYWADAGLECTFARQSLFTDAIVIRLRDPETDIVWRFEVERGAFLARDVQATLLELYEEQEPRIRQATFYVHHCREVLRAVQQDRHEAYMRELLAQPAEAQA